MHSKDFHDNIEILDGFEFYDRNVDCRLTNCASNKINRHFHCTRPNCNYSFVQYSTMAVHNQKHAEENKLPPTVGEIRVKSESLLTEDRADTSESQFRAMNLSQSSTLDNKVSGKCGLSYLIAPLFYLDYFCHFFLIDIIINCKHFCVFL